MSILIKDLPLAGYEISIMKDGERYRARVDGIWCEVEEIPTTGTDSDTISRKAAIEALKNDMASLDNIIKGMSANDVRLDAYVSQRNQVNYDIYAIEQLPPAQPEPHWIPVTEATPTEDDDYWATFEAETGRFVDWASWYQGRWVTWIEGSPAPLSNVIAWCKPMEPYKGVTE